MSPVPCHHQPFRNLQSFGDADGKCVDECVANLLKLREFGWNRDSDHCCVCQQPTSSPSNVDPEVESQWNLLKAKFIQESDKLKEEGHEKLSQLILVAIDDTGDELHAATTRVDMDEWKQIVQRLKQKIAEAKTSESEGAIPPFAQWYAKKKEMKTKRDEFPRNTRPFDTINAMITTADEKIIALRRKCIVDNEIATNSDDWPQVLDYIKESPMLSRLLQLPSSCGQGMQLLCNLSKVLSYERSGHLSNSSTARIAKSLDELIATAESKMVSYGNDLTDREWLPVMVEVLGWISLEVVLELDSVYRREMDGILWQQEEQKKKQRILEVTHEAGMDEFSALKLEAQDAKLLRPDVVQWKNTLDAFVLSIEKQLEELLASNDEDIVVDCKYLKTKGWRMLLDSNKLRLLSIIEQLRIREKEHVAGLEQLMGLREKVKKIALDAPEEAERLDACIKNAEENQKRLEEASADGLLGETEWSHDVIKTVTDEIDRLMSPVFVSRKAEHETGLQALTGTRGNISAFLDLEIAEESRALIHRLTAELDGNVVRQQQSQFDEMLPASQWNDILLKANEFEQLVQIDVENRMKWRSKKCEIEYWILQGENIATWNWTNLHGDIEASPQLSPSISSPISSPLPSLSLPPAQEPPLTGLEQWRQVKKKMKSALEGAGAGKTAAIKQTLNESEEKLRQLNAMRGGLLRLHDWHAIIAHTKKTLKERLSQLKNKDEGNTGDTNGGSCTYNTCSHEAVVRAKKLISVGKKILRMMQAEIDSMDPLCLSSVRDGWSNVITKVEDHVAGMQALGKTLQRDHALQNYEKARRKMQRMADDANPQSKIWKDLCKLLDETEIVDARKIFGNNLDRERQSYTDLVKRMEKRFEKIVEEEKKRQKEEHDVGWGRWNDVKERARLILQLPEQTSDNQIIQAELDSAYDRLLWLNDDGMFLQVKDWDSVCARLEDVVRKNEQQRKEEDEAGRKRYEELVKKVQGWTDGGTSECRNEVHVMISALENKIAGSKSADCDNQLSLKTWTEMLDSVEQKAQVMEAREKEARSLGHMEGEKLYYAFKRKLRERLSNSPHLATQITRIMSDLSSQKKKMTEDAPGGMVALEQWQMLIDTGKDRLVNVAEEWALEQKRIEDEKLQTKRLEEERRRQEIEAKKVARLEMKAMRHREHDEGSKEWDEIRKSLMELRDGGNDDETQAQVRVAIDKVIQSADLKIITMKEKSKDGKISMKRWAAMLDKGHDAVNFARKLRGKPPLPKPQRDTAGDDDGSLQQAVFDFGDYSFDDNFDDEEEEEEDWEMEDADV